MYTPLQVERSIRRFRDHSEDVLTSVWQTFQDRFGRFLDFLESDAVMHEITAPLKQNPNVDVDEWFGEFMETGGSMVGSKTYQLPTDENDRLALKYQFFHYLAEGRIRWIDFSIWAFGHTRYDPMLDSFKSQLLRPFIRDFSRRLDELQEDVEPLPQVSAAHLHIFQNYGMVVEGDVQGANIAVGNSTISGSHAVHNDTSALAQQIESLTAELESVPNDSRNEVAEAIQRLAQSVDKEKQNPIELAEAAQTIAQASPTLRQRLSEIVTGATANLAATGAVQAITYVLGILG